MWMIKFGESQVNWSQFMLFLGKLAYMLPAGPTSLSVGFKSPVSYGLTLAVMGQTEPHGDILHDRDYSELCLF